MSLSARLGGSFSYPFTADRVCFLFFHDKKKSSFLFRVQEQHDYYWKYAEQTGLVSTHVLKMRGPCTCFFLFFFSSEGKISSCYNHLQYDEGELKDLVRKIHFNA